MQIGESLNQTTTATSVSLQTLRRLGRNVGRYCGEVVEMASILEECRCAGAATGWTPQKIDAQPGLDLVALHRASNHSHPKRVYISAGIHGDEPAGPVAIRNLLQADALPRENELWICPCLNPTGFQNNCRENSEGHDLNRQYLRPAAREIIAHVAWLEQQPRFDLCLCLHEDWESQGFYIYELNSDGSQPAMAQRIVDAVSRVCPIDESTVIDGRPASGGVIRPAFEPNLRPDWPEAFFLLMHKTRLCYTLEAPSDFPLRVRVEALEMAVRTCLKLLETEPVQAADVPLL